MDELNFLEIGHRIRKQREFLGYTREQLAERIDITPKFCSDIEIGASGMSIKTLNNLSGALKLSTDYILYGVSDSNDIQPIINMLKACDPDKLKYAEDILKSFLLAVG